MIERNRERRWTRASADDVGPVLGQALLRRGLAQSRCRQAITHLTILPPSGSLGLLLDAELDAESVKSVERGGFVALRESREVEDGIGEVIDLAVMSH
jgi:hypothetical protein